MVLLLDIQDLTLLKITYVKEWQIRFDYGDVHYLLHGTEELGEPDRQELYKRTVFQDGKYDLYHIATHYGSENVCNDYIRIRNKSKKVFGYYDKIVYGHIDKEFFAYKLTKRGFASGIMENKVKEESQRISKIQKQIMELQNQIDELRQQINDYI